LRADKKRLLLFGVARLREMIEKGNMSYVRHYEQYFDDIYVVYLLGNNPRVLRIGRVMYISLGGRLGNGYLDLFCAPFRLWYLVKRINPTSYMTADILFSWWTTSFLRLLRKVRIVLMPVCLPEEIYRDSGNTLSGLPKWVERILMMFCFRSSSSVLVNGSTKTLLKWLDGQSGANRKMIAVQVTGEELPPPCFYEAIKEEDTTREEALSNPPILLYVGRLHVEKRPYDLLDLMSHLKTAGQDAILKLAGDGPERNAMEKRAKELDVGDRVEFLGYVPAENLPQIYIDADIFISTVTGTSLREAGLSGLPIVGLNIDWIRGFLKHEETALLVSVGDTQALACQVTRLLKDNQLRLKLGNTIRDFMWKKYSPALLCKSLALVFGPDTEREPV
jgi:glycosyltransferase involved in cell wall biosynthesis